MSGLMNITRNFKQQGLDTQTLHEAVVVDNKDPRKLCRVRARVASLFDGIPDNCLPWCIPMFGHIDGAYINNWNGKGGKETERSGISFIPGIDSKILVRFMNGDPHFPVWTGYTCDDKVTLKDELSGDSGDRYPHRAVFRMRNGAYLIMDSKSNELFVNMPGDLYLTILGDVHETIVGSRTTKVTSNLGDIPSYVKNAPASKLSQMEQTQNKKVPWEGLTSYKSGGGNNHTYVEGDETIWVKGNRIVKVDGNNTEDILGNERINIRGNQVINAQHIMHQEI